MDIDKLEDRELALALADVMFRNGWMELPQ